jgi:hypothetical protein
MLFLFRFWGQNSGQCFEEFLATRNPSNHCKIWIGNSIDNCLIYFLLKFQVFCNIAFCVQRIHRNYNFLEIRIHLVCFFPHSPNTRYRWLVLEGLLCGSFFLIFSVFEEIVTIFSLTGAIFGVLVFYVFPVLYYIKVEKSILKRIPAIIVLIFTVIFGIVGFVAILLGILKSKFGVDIPI